MPLPSIYECMITMLVFSLFLQIQPTICPDPATKLEAVYDGSKDLVYMRDHVYEDWASRNEKTLIEIAHQVNWIHELRLQCPVGPNPLNPPVDPSNPAANTPRSSLSFLIRGIEAVYAAFQEDVTVMYELDHPLALGNFIREKLGWPKEEVQTRAELILETLQLGILQMKDLWKGYKLLDDRIKKDWIRAPTDDPQRTGLFVAMWLAYPEPTTEEGNRDTVVVNADSIREKKKIFEQHMRWMNHAATVGKEWAELAEESELDNQVYTEMLSQEYFDPDYEAGVNNPDFNALGIFLKAWTWYECWSPAVHNIKILLDKLTPLPGLKEEPEDQRASSETYAQPDLVPKQDVKLEPPQLQAYTTAMSLEEILNSNAQENSNRDAESEYEESRNGDGWGVDITIDI